MMKSIIGLVFFVNFCGFLYSNPQVNIDSLKLKLANCKNDTSKIKILNTLCIELHSINPTQALEYCLLASDLITVLKKENPQKDVMKLEAVNNIGKGNINMIKGNYDKADTLFREALKFYSIENDSINIANLNSNIGDLFWYSGKYTKALEQYLIALRLFEKLKNKNGISRNLINIGNIKYTQNDFQSALEYYINAKKISEESGVKARQAMCLNNISAIYFQTKKFNLALETYFQAFKINEEINDRQTMAMCWHNIGITYRELKNNKSSLEFLLKAKHEFEKLGDRFNLCKSFSDIANTFNEIGNYKMAIEYNNLGLVIANELKSFELIKDIYESLSISCEKSAQPEEALKYYKLFKENNDSLTKETSGKYVKELDVKYQNEKKQKEIELLNKDKKLQDIEVRSQKIQKYGFIVGFVLMLFLTYVIFRSYRIKKKAHHLLLEKNAEILQQKEEITSQAEQLESTNKELEQLSIVARETDNSVVIASKDGELEWANMGFIKMYGYTLEMYKSEKGSNIISSSSNTQIKEIMQRCIENKNSVIYTSAVTTRLGKNKWVQTTLTPLFDNNLQLHKLIAIDTDITKIKEAESEIMQQKEELQTQSELLSQINTDLSLKNIQIMDSINYACLIQEAILPAKDYISSIFTDSFVLYKPKNVVSGDFYWLHIKNNFIFIAVIDCTGHGVPGAFMSMIGNTLLNEIITSDHILSPAKILEQLNLKVIQALKQGGENLESEGDGMDISLCRIDKVNKEILFSGANNPLYISNDNRIDIIRGDFISIGSVLNKRKQISFNEHCLKYTEKSVLYLFSDGFYDQFGGSNDSKYQEEKFKVILEQNISLPLNEQKQILEKTFIEWKGSRSQTDDITVIGMKI